MGLENPVHLIFIAAIALIVLGPKRLPELARALGHGIREFRDSVGQQADQPVAPVREPAPGELAVRQQAQAVQPPTPAETVQPPGQAETVQPPTQAETVQPPTGAAAETEQPSAPVVAEAVTAAPAHAVDPTETVRSLDAPDRRPL